MKIAHLFPVAVIAVLVFAGCNRQGERSPSKSDTTASKPMVAVPVFNEDSALLSVKTQLDFGPRVPNTPAHAKCADYLSGKLKGYAEELIIQQGQVKAFNGTNLNFKNIIASWKPGIPNRIFLCAHWDSRPWADHDPDPANRKKPVDAANDGASGVGVLMEIARQLAISAPSVGVDIILFDVEDYGPPEDHPIDNSEEFWGQGAQYWAKNPHKQNYSARYGILLDMVGAKNATFLMEGVSLDYASDIVKQVWNTAGRIGYSSYFIFDRGGYITDDHVPINRIMGIPTIDIIHLNKTSPTGFYPYWHTTGDTFDKIDKNTLKVVGQTLLTVIYEEK